VNQILPCIAAGSALQQRRNLSIHEHQAMELLKAADIPVPAFKVATDAEDVFHIAEDFG